jgi:hypothetical protein
VVTLHKVIWRDAAGGSNMGWRSIIALKEIETATVISCGAIIYEDDEKIIICPHMIIENDEISEGDAEIAIPKSWIVSNLKMAVFPEGD